jgi:hypothetical protein
MWGIGGMVLMLMLSMYMSYEVSGFCTVKDLCCGALCYNSPSCRIYCSYSD